MLSSLQTEFTAYKVRAQSVLKQKKEAASVVNIDELRAQVRKEEALQSEGKGGGEKLWMQRRPATKMWE